MGDIKVGNRFLIRKVREENGSERFQIYLADGTKTDKWYGTLKRAKEKTQRWVERGTGPGPTSRKTSAASAKKPTQTSPKKGGSTPIGLFSDTHCKHKLVEAAIDLFEDAGCQAVCHSGDFSDKHDSRDGLRSLEMMVDRLGKTPLFWVPGNHDQAWAHAKKVPGRRLSKPGHEHGKAVIAGKRFGLAHGTYHRGNGQQNSQKRLIQWLEDGTCDYLLHGHFHEMNVKYPTKRSPAVVIDPGGFYHRPNQDNKPRTVAILDVGKNIITFYVWKKKRFGELCTIDLRRKGLQTGEAHKSWKQDAKAWRRASRKSELGDNWAAASHHIYEDMDAWLSHEAIWRG